MTTDTALGVTKIVVDGKGADVIRQNVYSTHSLPFSPIGRHSIHRTNPVDLVRISIR